MFLQRSPPLTPLRPTIPPPPPIFLLLPPECTTPILSHLLHADPHTTEGFFWHQPLSPSSFLPDGAWWERPDERTAILKLRRVCRQLRDHVTDFLERERPLPEKWREGGSHHQGGRLGRYQSRCGSKADLERQRVKEEERERRRRDTEERERMAWERERAEREREVLRKRAERSRKRKRDADGDGTERKHGYVWAAGYGG